MSARPANTRTLNSRTQERLANLRLLIELLRHGELMRDEVAAPMQVKVRTARAYFDELEQVGIIEVARRTERPNNLRGKPVFRLAADDARIDSFLADAGVGPRSLEPKAEVGELAVARRMPGRRFHIMEDDRPFCARVHNGPVVPDPYALPPAFFGARFAALEMNA